MQGGDVNQAQSEGFKIGTFVRAYMTHGHLQADLDPLELNKAYDDLSQSKFRGPSEIMRDILSVENYNFTEQDSIKCFLYQHAWNYACIILSVGTLYTFNMHPHIVAHKQCI